MLHLVSPVKCPCEQCRRDCWLWSRAHDRQIAYQIPYGQKLICVDRMTDGRVSQPSISSKRTVYLPGALLFLSFSRDLLMKIRSGSQAAAGLTFTPMWEMILSISKTLWASWSWDGRSNRGNYSNDGRSKRCGWGFG